MGTVDASTLLPNDHVKKAVLAGKMTQISRGQAYAAEGDTFEIDDQEFVVVGVDELTLGELTDADAQREGSADLEAYRERLVAAHGGNFEWDDDVEIVRHRFEAK
ncbi:ASCH domain-containing protein [Halohasta litorea]|uniref:ASCH domain-containing protein n=1 Tax=Halohasta litorea TaxID=869891 RepID=A0ABD6D7L9_9EURY|nr:ASCH domain-containing protein [Halohasta litorea]